MSLGQCMQLISIVIIIVLNLEYIKRADISSKGVADVVRVLEDGSIWIRWDKSIKTTQKMGSNRLGDRLNTNCGIPGLCCILR